MIEQLLTNSSIWNDWIFFLNKYIWLVMMTESKAFMNHKRFSTKVTVIVYFNEFGIETRKKKFPFSLFLKNIFQRNIREQIFKLKGAFYISGFRKIESVSNIHKSLSKLSCKLLYKVEALFRIWFQFYKFLDVRFQPVILWFHPSMVSNTGSCLSVWLFAIFLRNHSKFF